MFKKYLMLTSLGYTCFEKNSATILLKFKCLGAVNKSSTQDHSSCTGPVTNSNYIKTQPDNTFHNHSFFKLLLFIYFILGLIFIQNV